MMFEQPQVLEIPVKPSRPLGAFLNQAVREYRDKLVERLLRRPMSKPWMKYREIRIIEEILGSLKPLRALEWGCGFGTLHFARRLPEDSEWISVEHDTDWAERIRSLRTPRNVRVYTIPPDHAPWSGQDGSYADFRTYVDFPAQLGKFDFILVDGRARAACLRCAHELLNPSGVVVLHDANREFHHAPWSLFPRQAAFRDYRRFSGGMWIGGKDRDLGTLADLNKHRKIWDIYNSLGKGFRL